MRRNPAQHEWEEWICRSGSRVVLLGLGLLIHLCCPLINMLLRSSFTHPAHSHWASLPSRASKALWIQSGRSGARITRSDCPKDRKPTAPRVAVCPAKPAAIRPGKKRSGETLTEWPILFHSNAYTNVFKRILIHHQHCITEKSINPYRILALLMHEAITWFFCGVWPHWLDLVLPLCCQWKQLGQKDGETVGSRLNRCNANVQTEVCLLSVWRLKKRLKALLKEVTASERSYQRICVALAGQIKI